MSVRSKFYQLCFYQILLELVYSWESYRKNNMMLSYRRETALQGALVLATSGRLELGDNIFTDIIGLYSTTVI